ncbi:MAG: M3 family metallopeptidase [Burkholderiales bacterium]
MNARDNPENNATTATDNPLLASWTAPFGLPPFGQVTPDHFGPAFDAALAQFAAEVDALRAQGEPPTFDNTIAQLDRTGRTLGRVTSLFFNLAANCSSPPLQAVEREIVPRLAAASTALMLDEKIFARVDALYQARDTLALAPEARQLLERVWLDFTFAGAALPPAARARVGEIKTRLATLYTSFRQNLLAEEDAWQLVLRTEAELAGLPPDVRDAARAAAVHAGLPDAWVITLSRSLVVPFLSYSDRRDLRERAFKASTTRGGNAGAHDNRPVIREILALRHELAQLQGHANFARFALVDRMAGSPEAVADLLARVWEPAKRRAAEERDQLQAFAHAHGDAITLEPWDWRYYAEKVRAERYHVDLAALKPYFPLDRMVEAMFDCAGRLFGIRFLPRPDLPVYHPDVRVYEVRNRDDKPIGIFLADNFARPGKRSGAWMSAYRWQSRLDGEVLPIIANHNNFAQAPAGEPTLLSPDDVRTLFHEFGHGLHGLLSQVTYERLSGTRVLRDFVEMPSQIFEHWAVEPSVLREHARHYRTGEPIPEALLAQFRAAELFNQGFETVEYAACVLVDMALHAHPDPAALDLDAFETEELARLAMPSEIVMRHRLPHFGHLFGGEGYAAGYYVYMWAEVLDADGFSAFAEAGDPFHPELAARLHEHVYAAGATRDPREAFRAFRGRDPRVEPMLAGRGL